MGLKRDESGRLHIETPLMAESLMDKQLLQRTETEHVFRPLPDINVIKLGGQSVIDRGAKVVLPLLDEIVAARGRHQLLVMTGGGTRSRHAYAIALDLGMPTGVLAKLGQAISEQNALMISILLTPHGGVKIGHDEIVQLPAYLALGVIPVMHAMPPYGLFEEPAEHGRIPPHRTDVGTYLTAEVLGARRCILVKDERGLYTADPKKDPTATRYAELTFDEAIVRTLKVMDATALALCRDQNMLLKVFSIFVPGALKRVVLGSAEGTLVHC
ncbi:MAG: uridine kinase [Proteobacteria bacterium]|nr:uridine kinase [Pseudomonadota bacterium]